MRKYRSSLCEKVFASSCYQLEFYLSPAGAQQGKTVRCTATLGLLQEIFASFVMQVTMKSFQMIAHIRFKFSEPGWSIQSSAPVQCRNMSSISAKIFFFCFVTTQYFSLENTNVTYSQIQIPLYFASIKLCQH